MTIVQTDKLTSRKPLRLWPGVIMAVLLLLVRFVIPFVVPGAGGTAILGGLAGGLAVLVWWLFFSRAPWSERVGVIVLMVGGVFATSRIVHESIANGMMGMMLPIFAIPVLSLALVASAAASRRLSNGSRRAVIAAAILLACGSFTLLRTGGITGDAASDLHWRWTKSPEERLLAESAATPSSASASAATAEPLEKPATPTADKPLDLARDKPLDTARDKPASVPADFTATKTTPTWPGFRGPGRDSIIHGTKIETDWSKSPPVALWRRPIGPGWSSFAVRGDLVYTQEQRGGDEDVSCYNLTTGKLVWRQRDSARFWESNQGHFRCQRSTPCVELS